MKDKNSVGLETAKACRLAIVAVALMLLPQSTRAIGQEAIEPLPSLQQKIIAAAEKAKPSVVQITWRGTEQFDELSSGVIISIDGYVATILYARRGKSIHHLPPGKSVAVQLADGRSAAGVVVGVSVNSLGIDFDLVKITQEGVWPAAEIGRAEDVKPGGVCLALGYAQVPESMRVEQQPSVRVGHLAAIEGLPGRLRSSCRTDTEVGECGGGLFDTAGRLIGIHYVGGTLGKSAVRPLAWHFDIKVVEQNWRELARRNSTAGVAATKQAPIDAGSSQIPLSSIRAAQGFFSLCVRADKAVLASVHFVVDGRPRVSGTIITADGYIATCAHHNTPRGTDVTVRFADGRTAPAKVLGCDHKLDIGLLKITAPGPWPFVERKKVADVRVDDVCILAGYPAIFESRNRAIVVRVGQIDHTQATPDELEHTCVSWGGDSGCGLFDREGQLIGINNGPGRAVAIDWIERHWDFLVNGSSPGDLEPLPSPTAEALQKAVQPLPPITVEVLGDGKRRAMGTIISSDGHVLTKASELYGEISCRLADGRTLAAVLRNVSREHDLALLKIDATGLPEAAWSRGRDVPVGTLAAALPFGESPIAGGVAYPTRKVAATAGYLAISRLKDVDGGVEVGELRSWWDDLKDIHPFRVGDAILSIEGRPVPNVKALEQLAALRADGLGWDIPFVIAGDPIRVVVRRGGKEQEARFPLLSLGSEPGSRNSARSTAFPAVFDFDASAAFTKDMCGGPIVNHEGQVVGIAIALPTRERVYAIPAAVARTVAEELK
jgi:serine protease Do